MFVNSKYVHVLGIAATSATPVCTVCIEELGLELEVAKSVLEESVRPEEEGFSH
jgi:hypothetical protein